MSFITNKIIFRVTTLVTNQYRFYVDFKGFLYFQDTKNFIYPNAIKDQKFIKQLYQNLIPSKFLLKNIQNLSPQQCLKQKKNIEENKQYPFFAQFWGQRNFVKCALSPIIYTRIIKKLDNESEQQNQNNSTKEYLQFSIGQISIFDYKQIQIDDEGRIWHPFIPRQNKNIKQQQKLYQQNRIYGLFSNELMVQILQNISFDKQDVFIIYNDTKTKIKKTKKKHDLIQSII